MVEMVLSLYVRLLLCALLLSAALLTWWFYRLERKERTQLTLLGQGQQEQDKARCEAIEAGLREWMKMLGMPQLEEETKLRASARQLRIVLVEKLMRGPRVR